ncbi:hypothetical protein EVG20_g9404, partial [Dentipellis fragilis]
ITSHASKLYSTSAGRRTLLYPIIQRDRRHFTPAILNSLAETDTLREKTSKKDPEARAQEVRAAVSPDLVSWIAREGAAVSRDTGGSLVVTEVMLEADGDKPEAMDALLAPLAEPYPSEDPTKPHSIDLPHTARMCKTLLQGGHFSQASRKVESAPRFDASAFAAAFVRIVGRERTLQIARGGGAFVVAELLERVKEQGSGQTKAEVKKWVKELGKDSAEGEGVKGWNVLMEKVECLARLMQSMNSRAFPLRLDEHQANTDATATSMVGGNQGEKLKPRTIHISIAPVNLVQGLFMAALEFKLKYRSDHVFEGGVLMLLQAVVRVLLRTTCVIQCTMTPDTDDLSSTFVPHSSQGYYPVHRSPVPLHMSFETPLQHPLATYRRSSTDSNANANNIQTISPSDDGVKHRFQIDMKDLVGDAVGNMSISPSYRDVVLAARKGLFIIDLEAPLEVPRFLPQGGTWDVADVQWNPHPARSEYVVSTSSEKLLIWNLLLAGQTSIQHVLHAHYRAITDINWHTKDPDIVVSTGIDSWLWAWDLRTTNKPVMGFCAFNAGGTQVKWNRQDGNVLASSHMNEVLIWDRRKGSVPVQRIEAHTAKIYGIDWAHNSSREIVTCSLDKTIKVWDVQAISGGNATDSFRHPLDASSLAPQKCIYEPRTIINTTYPVWRARDLPFGKGVLSLPQRGENALELWTHGANQPAPLVPVEVFEGHTDTVKEFLAADWSEFQLITWSKDKTLRFWPMDPDAMAVRRDNLQEHGSPHAHKATATRNSPSTPHPRSEKRGPRSPPQSGHRGTSRRGPRSRPRCHNTSSRRAQSEQELTPTVTSAPMTSARKGGTMSRGNVAGRPAQMDMFTWISNVKVNDKAKDGSSGTGSGQESGNVSRMGSRSRATSREPGLSTIPGSLGAVGRRSDSRTRWDDEGEGQSLKDEITSVLHKLSTSKIKLEKHDLTKKRTFTLGLHGPWGESSSVFIRITFTFPKDYPQAMHPGGTPIIDLEHTSLISMRNRAFILRRLRAIRENRRPCLEACLRFLIFGNEDEHERMPVRMGFESSSEEDDDSVIRKGRSTDVVILHNDKNIAEPRTSQGVFGPNGELVCFNRAPPRIVRNPMHEFSASASPSSGARSISIPRLFQSPALLSDAVRRLAVASQDRRVSAPHSRNTDDGDNILHIMTNLLLASRLKQRRASEQSRALDEIPANYALLPTRIIMVYIKDVSYVVGAGRALAGEYVFDDDVPGQICRTNAAVAKKHRRYDHERFFNTMAILLPDAPLREVSDLPWGANPLAYNLILEMYKGFAREKDIQMLAMLAVLLLKMYKHTPPPGDKSTAVRVVSPLTPGMQRTPSGDYFTLRRRKENRSTPLSPIGWHRGTPSPTTNNVSTSISSMSSRGSWSSLFNTGGMRQFMAGVHEAKERTPEDRSDESTPGIPVPGGGGRRHPHHYQLGSESPRSQNRATPSPQPPTHPQAQMKSWPEGVGAGALRIPVVPSNANVRRPTFSQIVSARPSVMEKMMVVYDFRDSVQQERAKEMDLFEPKFLGQLVTHISVYAEILFRWELLHKRIELLKAMDREFLTTLDPPTEVGSSKFGVTVLCMSCGNDETPRGKRSCMSLPIGIHSSTNNAIKVFPIAACFATMLTISHAGSRRTWTHAQLDADACAKLTQTRFCQRLKKLIHDIVEELQSIGLTPELLQTLLQEQKVSLKHANERIKGKAPQAAFDTSDTHLPKVVYELGNLEEGIEPRLHIWMQKRTETPTPGSVEEVEAETKVDGTEGDEEGAADGQRNSGLSLLYGLQKGAALATNHENENDERASMPPLPWQDGIAPSELRPPHEIITIDASQDNAKEVIIPLVYDSAFYHLLSDALQTISKHLDVVHVDFVSTLRALALRISSVARPLSATSKFQPHSQTSDPATVTSPLISWPAVRSQSDLSAWREVFQLYAESEVFDNMSERARGERSIEDSEARLKAFAERVTDRGLGDRRTLKLAESRKALETFLHLNVFLLDLKKFQEANAEATRKILKKHAKRTALPLPVLSVAPGTGVSNSSLAMALDSPQPFSLSPTAHSDSLTLVVPHTVAMLPRMLVQAIGETLIPIIPHVDDYACLICTSIAFKPIRLFCGHLFCVRCLVKMQKRGKGNCPMCRAPTVLQADRSNVDWALLNLMQDWFPDESREKLKQNEREAAKEELEELGLDSQGCVIC